MPKLNAFIICITYLLLEIFPGYSQVNSVSVKIHEVSSDSLGPWTNSVQHIDSLEQDGSILSRSTRVWDGSQWLNQSNETFLYDLNDQVTDNVKFQWNGLEYTPLIKTENNYDGTGKLNQIINYQYNSGSWEFSTKHEHLYDLISSTKTITGYTFIAGTWNQNEQHILKYNSNQTLNSELKRSWNGTSWDTTIVKSYKYSTLSGDLLSDSTFYYSSAGLMLQQAVQYSYINPAQLCKVITQDFYSFIYSDADTIYIESELYYEYTVDLIRNASGQIIEKHGAQTRGSAQAWAYEHTYFQFNQSGDLLYVFKHEGTNLSSSFTRQNLYDYSLLNMNYLTSGESCIGCANGSIEISANGGVTPYHLTLNSNSGTILGMSILDLPPGDYNFCLVDNIGNEICRDVTILEYTNGIYESEHQSLFTVQNTVGSNELKINNNYNSHVSLLIVDLRGKIITEQVIAPGSFLLQLNNITPGNYFYTSSGTGQINSGKLVFLK